MPGLSESTRSGIILRDVWRKDSQPPLACKPIPAPSAQPAKKPADKGKKARRGRAKPTAHTRKPRAMPRRYEKSPAMRSAEAYAKAKGIVHEIPPLGRYRFATFEEFNAFVIEYFASQQAGYRKRSTLSTEARNNQLMKLNEADIVEGKVQRAPRKLLPWNSPDIMYCIAYWCLHGCTQRSRGKGERLVCSTRYTGCTARITGRLKSEVGPDGELHWFVEAVNEIATHNHTVSEAVWKTYNTTALILTDEELFKKVVWGIEIGGDPRLVRDVVSRETQSTYSQRKYDNLSRYWLGGAPVLRSLQDLLEAFAELPGSRCLVINDDDGVLAGVVMQSSAQRALVQACGDTLVLDWTHNTNNRGFHQGALLATTTNGTGVSVLDFLCVSQSSKMMERVFDFFIEHNPGAKEKLESVVIDKDLAEWKTVAKMFQTIVVLCIFHVLKWFKWVITQAKYSIGIACRDGVLACLTAMVYAVSVNAFEAQKTALRLLLQPDLNAGHQAFIAYMEQNWYAHSTMWSHAERGCVFTGGNTTSNRIESWWNQFKATLGGRRRLDLCVEAIFQHATLVLRREEDLLAARLAKTPLYEDADDKLRPVLMELSSYAAKRVQRQWTKYLARRGRFRVLQRAAGGLFTVRHAGAQDVDSCVDTTKWTCSCRFYRSIHMPCRHLFFVAHEELRLPVYPTVAIARRWRMSEAASLLPAITRSVKELEQLRTNLLRRANRAATDADGASPTTHFTVPRRIAHVCLRKHEISDSRVLLDLEKRNLCMSATEPLGTFAMGLTASDCKVFVNELVGLLAEFSAKWQAQLCEQASEPPGDATSGGADEPAGVIEDGGQQTQADVLQVPSESPSAQMDAEQAAWRACRVSADDDYELECEDVDEETSAQAATPLVTTEAATDSAPLGTIDDDDEDKQIAIALKHALLDQLIAATAAEERDENARSAIMTTSDSWGESGGAPSSKRRRTEPPQASVASPATSQQDTSSTTTTRRVDEGMLAFCTLPPEMNRTLRKSAKQQAKAARPLAYVEQTGKQCPIDIFQHNLVVRFSVPDAAAVLQSQMPRILTESTVLRRQATAAFTSFQPRTLRESNAIVPVRVLEMLLAAVDRQRVEDGAEAYASGARVGDELWAPQYFATIRQLRSFPEELLRGISEFYDLEAKLATYKNDLLWASGPWEAPDKPQRVPFLQAQVDALEGAEGTFQSVIMRAEIKRAYSSIALGATLTLPEASKERSSQVASIPLLEIVGRVSFDAKLNDSVVNFSMQLLASMYADAVVIDSLSVDKIRIPQCELKTTRLICFPLHYDGDHWCILFAVRDGKSWRAWSYDPLVKTACHAFMASKWDSWCRPLIAAWAARDQRRAQVKSADVVDVTKSPLVVPLPGLEEVTVTAVRNPKQPDGTSCGLFCVAQAADYMTHRYRFQIRQPIQPFTVELMRLRLLWLLLCKSTIIVDPADQARARQYLEKFSSYRT